MFGGHWQIVAASRTFCLNGPTCSCSWQARDPAERTTFSYVASSSPHMWFNHMWAFHAEYFIVRYFRGEKFSRSEKNAKFREINFRGLPKHNANIICFTNGPRVSFFWFTGCDGCELAMLDALGSPRKLVPQNSIVLASRENKFREISRFFQNFSPPKYLTIK